MLPNWIIVGAPKSGTSSLFRWLVDHPEASGSAEKETYYFVDPGSHMYRPQINLATGGIAGYEALFAHCAPGSHVIVESTPGYMYSTTALRELPELPSRPDFIFILREPVDQLKSLYSYFRGNWAWIPSTMSFRDFIATVERGTFSFNGNELAAWALTNANYLEHLRRWRSRCGAERMHVYLFEDMVRDKRPFMRSLAQTMGLFPAFYDHYEFPTENRSYTVRSKLAQTINIKIRSAIPKGRCYNALRSVYRVVNTRPAPSFLTKDLEIERTLSQRYMCMARDLEREFDLDTSAWRQMFAARLEGHQTQEEDRFDAGAPEVTGVAGTL